MATSSRFDGAKAHWVRLCSTFGQDPRVTADPPPRVMMGSDFPWYDIDHTVGRVLALPGLSAEKMDDILGENAIRFFRLSL